MNKEQHLFHHTEDPRSLVLRGLRAGLLKWPVPTPTPARAELTARDKQKNRECMARLRTERRAQQMREAVAVAVGDELVRRLAEAEAQRSGVPVNAVLSRSKMAVIVAARHRVMFAAHAAGRTCKELALLWGCNDSVVRHSIAAATRSAYPVGDAYKEAR